MRAVVLIAALLISTTAHAVTTNPPNYPSTCVTYNTCTTSADCPSSATCTSGACVGRTAWTSASNAQASDDARASASLAASAQSQWLKCTGFGFTTTPLDDAKVIQGITAELEVQQGGPTIIVQDIRAIKSDGTIASTSRATGTGCVGAWTGADTFKSCGGSFDLWGVSWTPADIRDTDFGIAVSVLNTNATTTRAALVDALRVSISYSPPAGRVFVTGWDTQTAEDGVEVGSPEYTSAAAVHGAAGLHLSTTANTAESWSTPATLDADLSDRAYARLYWKTTPTIPAGQSVVALTIKQDSEIGCYLTVAVDSAGCFSYHPQYHGKEPGDLDFSSYPATNSATVNCASTLAGHAVEMGQILTADTVACSLYVDGTPTETFSLDLNAPDSCAGNACDIAGAGIGSPATGAVANYASFPAYTLDVDDFVVDNLHPIGVGYLEALFPNANGNTISNWSNTCAPSSTAWDCLNDWSGGGTATSCTAGDTRQKSASTGIDQFGLTDLTPLATSASVASVRGVVNCCGTSSSDNIRLSWRSNGTDTVGPNGTVVSSSAGTILSQTLATDFGSGNAAWTESTIDALQLGYDRWSAGASNVRCTAAMAYIDVTTPSPQADRNVQDLNGDGVVTVVTGCDSITRGTKTGTCLSIDGTSACTAACTSDADCDGGACVSGTCSMQCETSADCTCGTTALCLTALNWVNQFSVKAPQVTNLINCGRDTMPAQWWGSVLPAIIADPHSHAPPCRLIRGDWGHCSATTTQSCELDGDCPTGQTCTRYAADYVIDICGLNEAIGYGIAECTASSNIFGLQVPVLNDRWYRQACPLAATTPTTYQVTRKTCTADADCTGDSHYGTGSKCTGYCSGHQDPVWPCQYDDQCGQCTSPSTQSCYHQGTCVSGGINVVQSGQHYERCNADGDCPSGTCVSYESTDGTWDDAYGTCGNCQHNNCVSGGTKYCTPTCASITCATDADCSPAGAMGGLCNTGTGTCYACGTGFNYAIDTSAATQLLDAKRLASSPGGLRSDLEVARQQSITATVLAAGAHRMQMPYVESFQMGADEEMANYTVRLAKDILRTAPIVADTHFASKYADDRIAGATFGSLVFDGIHNFIGGATETSRIAAASFNRLYPVCSGDTSDVCGFCDVACTTNADCTKPTPVPTVIGASPSPTPAPTYTARAGACGTRTPGVNACGCSVDSDCAAGFTCEDIDPGAGTDKRCVGEQLSLCPAGDNTRARKRPAKDSLCASGTCSREMVPPLCTRQKTPCNTTADCLGYDHGDVCAADGVWQACEIDADCTRDGGRYADPVCAAATPIIGTSPTAKSRVCQQPTPTP